LPAALSQDLQTAVFLAALYYLALNDMASEYWTLTAAKRQMEANVSLAVGPVIFLILVILWLRSGGGLGGVVGCLAFGTVISAIVARFFRRWRIGRLRLVFGDATKTVMGELLGRNVLPYAVYGGAFTLLQADTLVVSVLGGAAMAAEFVLVWKIAEILILLLWKISESLQPYLIEADVQGDHSRISEFYRMARLGTWVCALIAGVFYAVFGPDVIALWVGDKHAPANPLYFVAAGGAVFWMASARVPVIFAYTFKRFGALNRILICEVVLKLGLVVVLVSQFSYGAPLIAINIVHVFGIAWAYVWLGKTVVESPKSHNS
jgi:O-antigen/teichoic acid export membrane protein